MRKNKAAETLQEACEEYDRKLAKSLDRHDDSPGASPAASGAPRKPLYTPVDVAGSDYLRDL